MKMLREAFSWVIFAFFLAFVFRTITYILALISFTSGLILLTEVSEVLGIILFCLALFALTSAEIGKMMYGWTKTILPPSYGIPRRRT